MNSFDPFISSEYNNDFKEDFPLDSSPNLIKKTESEFLSEILSYSFSARNKYLMDHTEPSTIPERESENEHNNESNLSIIESQSSKKKSSKNSPFHNFQKHLVITLRQILILKPLSIKSGIETETAEKLFSYFKNSQKTSRKFLEEIFGLYESKNSESSFNFLRTIRKSEVSHVIGDEKDETILEAYRILRQLTLLELEENDLEDVLVHRKIEKKCEFIEYINLFKRELIEGKQRKKTYKMLAKKFNN